MKNICYITVKAQEKHIGNTLNLAIGLHHLSLRDQNASPLIYQANLPQVSLQYRHYFSRAELQVGLGARYGKYYPEAYPNRMIIYGEVTIPVEDKVAIGTFYLYYLHQVYSSGKGKLLAGSGITQFLQYPLQAPYVGLIAITSVPVILQAKYWFTPKNSLESELQYSLAGLVTRLPWHASISLPEVTSSLKAFYQNNTHFTGGHRFQQFAWRTHLRHQLNNRFAIGLTYALERISHPDPHPLSSWSNNLSASWAINF